ncbi:MAG: hypothetical protein IKT27_03525 [Clostridia bacterium]|nr:hypothetical protein [Clostridia bacterium]
MMTQEEHLQSCKPADGVFHIRRLNVSSDLENDMFHFWKSNDDGCLDRKAKLANAEPVECEVIE